MTLIRRTSPWSQFTPQGSGNLFDESAFRPIARRHGSPRQLPLDITSNDDQVTIEAALAGIRPQDVEITAHQDALTISVNSPEQDEVAEGERAYREVRRAFGSRTVRLPQGLDVANATANFENGMLRLAVPRAEASKPRQIPVTSVVTEAPVTVAAETQVADGEAGPETAAQA
jgi:HSP20 family protein